MVKGRSENTWLMTSSLVVLAMIGIAMVLVYTQAVMVPFVLAIFIFSLSSPVLDYQVLRFKVPRSIAVIVTLLLVLAILVITFGFMVHAIGLIVSTAAEYSDSFMALVERGVDKLIEWDLMEAEDRGELFDALRKLIPKLASGTFGTAVNFSSSVLLVAIFVIFLLSGRNPHTVRKGVSAEIDQQIRRYLATKVAVSTATGLLVWFFLSIMKLKLASVFGLLAFLLNFIPSIGSIVATFLPVPIAVAQFQSPLPVVMVILLPGSIQMIIGNVIEPKLMGRGLNLHPVTIILALSVWGLLWGAVGMFLAVPLTAMFRIVCMQFETLRPVGLLMAGRSPFGEGEEEKIKKNMS